MPFLPVQFLFTLLFVVVVGLTWRRALSGSFSYIVASLWTGFWVLAGVVVWRPETTNFLASSVGIGRGADLVLYVSVIVLFYGWFRTMLRLEQMERQFTVLVRKMSLDDWEDTYEKDRNR